MRRSFREKDKIKCLLWSNRHCCLCGKQCGPDIEIAHIGKNTNTNINNAIPLCYSCHAAIGRYNDAHPRGSKYSVKELKIRRDQIYEEQTQKITPKISFNVSQTISEKRKRSLPDVGFSIVNMSDSLPVQVLVLIRAFLGKKCIMKEGPGHYSGKRKWNINPTICISGHFQLPKSVLRNKKHLLLKVMVTIIDKYEMEHKLLPISFVYTRQSNEWYVEP